LQNIFKENPRIGVKKDYQIITNDKFILKFGKEEWERILDA